MDVNGVDPNPYPILIQEVWAANLDKAFEDISILIDQYPCISMDTEYPGVIHTSAVHYSQLSLAGRYNLLKLNIDDLKLIQVGITLSDENGNLPELVINEKRVRVIWQFNFSDFDWKSDRRAETSFKLLVDSGIDFEKNLKSGIKSVDFGEKLMSSGLVLNDSVSWITFQGSYDIAFLLKILRGRNLPDELNEFLDFVRMFFGDKLYDLKHLMKSLDIHGGLDGLARELDVPRVAGGKHQAGSDSLVTCHVFYRMRDVHFVNGVPDAGILDGLN